MAANVFAYTTKGSIPNLANTNKGNIFNLKINEITYTKYSEPQTVENMGNRLYCGHIDIKTSAMTGNSRNLALSILISRPFNDKSIYPRYIEEIYLSGLEGKNQFVSRENKKLWLYSPSSNSTDHKIYLYEEELCSAETLDVYIFKPYYPAVSRAARTGLFAYLGVTLPVFSLINLYNFTSDSVFEDYQEKVYVHHYKRALLNQGYVISAFDLKRNASKLYNINNTENSSDGDAYFYNVDYAYGVPASSGTSAAATSVNCSTNCSGYTKSTTYPTSSVTVGGQSLSRGQVCYKCNDSGTMADRCNPFNGQKSGFTLNLASYPDLKTEICPNVGATNTSGSSGTPAQNTDAGRGSGGTQTPAECPAEYSMTFELYPNQKFKCVVEGTIPRYQSCSVTNGVVTISNVLSFENNSDQFRLSICSSIVQENQPNSNTVASNTPQNTLEILNNSNLSDINFSLNNTNWYLVNKIDNPESYILGNKTQDKNLSINLDSFNEGPIYAIISTANKKTEIETELKQIYQTGAFTNYVRQTGTNQFKIDATFTGFSKLEYSLDNNSKNLKINIKRENTLENIVLIFMQKSTDKVNLVYTNLYSLDNKSQSLFNYCMVNRNIVNFYCKGHNCSSNASCLSSGRWDFDPKIFEGLTPRAVETTIPVIPPVVVQPQSTFTGSCSIDRQTTLEEYITCLKNNLNVFDTTRRYSYSGSGGTGEQLMTIKYNDSSHCYTNTGFNDLIFTTAKNLNLTEEETAQLWSRIAAESGCSLSCGRGSDCGSDGVAQIMVSVWTSEYSRLRSQLLAINSSKYSSESKYKTELENSRNNPTTSLEISTAINRMNLANVMNASRNSTKSITTQMYTTYDHDDAIDLKFISAYLYCSPNYSFFSGGISRVYKNEGCAYTAFHKMGYYLAYKRMIYNCHKESTNNAFVTAYKTKYNGTYCR